LLLKEVVRFEVLTAVVMKTTILWDVMQCSPLGHLPIEYPDKSAVAEQNINLEYRIQLHHTTILSIKPRYTDRIIREATEIELHPNNIVAGRPAARQRP
jgi:hypothetical protein